MLSHAFWETFIGQSIRKTAGINADNCTEEIMNAMRTATGDASIMSLRKLDEFFCDLTRYKDNLHTDDFPGFGIKEQIFEPDSKRLINKHLAHLSEQQVGQEVTSFPYAKYLAKALPHCMEFCNYLKAHGTVFDADTRKQIEGMITVLSFV